MPHLERLAREGVVFDQATSVAPLTLPAHTQPLHGTVAPASRRPRQRGSRPWRPTHTTLAEMLQRTGFRTGAFVGSVVLDAGPRSGAGIRPVSRVSRTTPESRPQAARRPSSAATRQMQVDGRRDSLARRNRRIAASSCGRISTIRIGRTIRRSRSASRYSTCTSARSRSPTRRSAGCSTRSTQRQLLDRTIVIVAGDHGESLGEHGERDHGIFVYESVLRVPLIIRGPRLRAAARSATSSGSPTSCPRFSTCSISRHRRWTASAWSI